jgi:hypothetical protein
MLTLWLTPIGFQHEGTKATKKNNNMKWRGEGFVHLRALRAFVLNDQRLPCAS